MNNTKPPIKMPRLTKKDKKGQEKTKGELKVARDHYKYWKFHIHWKQWEYVMHIKRDIKIIPFVHFRNKYF